MTTRISGVQPINFIFRRDSENHCETDRINSIELGSNHRVLYFSDGTLELDTDNDEVDIPNRANVEFKESSSFLSRVKNKAYKMGSTVLSGIDYIGEELASFFGITSKPELNGIEFYKQNTSSINPEEGVNDGWVNGLNNNYEPTRTGNIITSEIRN